MREIGAHLVTSTQRQGTDSNTKKLQKLVFTHYNMKLKMRHQMRKSQEELEASFNPINLDYIFQEDDPLSLWIEERENPLLDGVQNSEWLPRIDTDDEDVEGDNDGNEGDDLSPPSNNSGDGGDGDIEGQENDGEDEQRQNDPYQEVPYNRRDTNLVVNFTTPGADMDSSDHLQFGKRKKNQHVLLEDSSSSSHIEQSFSYLGIDESSQSSQGYYPPPVYQFPYSNAYNPYTSNQVPPYYQSSMNQDDLYNQQQSGGYFHYFFGQGATQDDSQSESGGYDLPRHSTMW